ncbi:hypothetical protein [Methanobacterium lacus]|uniref:hypothetical protein n=1 Tax=Methanobacterium lacus (strain AL-21) TaxID=877455 RepID=UPI001305268A|nr:hypothetical protein [Methanobacterium lacus]
MTMKSIFEDALRYPFSDWKKILILGILLLIYTSNMLGYAVTYDIHSIFKYNWFR